MHHQADQSTQLFISHFRCLNWSTAFHSLADDLHSTNRRLPRCQSNRITFINEFNQSYVSRLTYPPNRVVERFCRSINMRSLTFSSISLYSIVPFLSVHMITIFWRLLTQQLRNVHCGCYQCTWSWLYCSIWTIQQHEDRSLDSDPTVHSSPLFGDMVQGIWNWRQEPSFSFRIDLFRTGHTCYWLPLPSPITRKPDRPPSLPPLSLWSQPST